MTGGKMSTELNIPKGFILFISGVPGVGKTTISYELLRRNREFRIIEETDILRDALRGYNEYLVHALGQPAKDLLRNIEIFEHGRLLSLDEAIQQCKIMSMPLNSIISRQQRKGIPSIINGVHIIPASMTEYIDIPNIAFVNLYVTDCAVLQSRLSQRKSTAYTNDKIQFIFKTNEALYMNTEKTAKLSKNVFNVDVSHKSVDETISEITECIQSCFCSGQ